jgi:hypothetical protein
MGSAMVVCFIAFFGMVFGVGAIAVITEHFQRMARIKAEGRNKGQQDVLAAIDALRREVASLRDTTTSYDLSFDTALQRVEARVAALESRSTTPSAALQGTRVDTE